MRMNCGCGRILRGGLYARKQAIMSEYNFLAIHFIRGKLDKSSLLPMISEHASVIGYKFICELKQHKEHCELSPICYRFWVLDTRMSFCH